MILLAFLFLLFALKHLHKDVLGPLAQLQSSLKQAIHQGWTQDLPRLSSSVDTTGKYAEILSLRRLIGILVRMTSRHHRSHLRKMEAVQVQVVHSSKMASLGQMASGIAHEINNPLSILMVRLTQLQKEITLNNKDKSYELIEQMEKVIFRIAKIIQSLKTFSREASSDPFQDILVTDLIQETMTLCERRISNSQIKVQVNVMPPDLCVKGQSVPLSQVLINLLNNAYDAVMTSPNKWIRIEAERSKSGAILIKVIDSGPKISPEVTRRIMEPFFTTKDVGAGVGLGLSISKGIVESHGGRLYLDQQAPHTTFVIEL